MFIGKHSYFFLDVCILLPQSLSISEKSCKDFLKDAGASCCISSSVYSRASKMLDDAYDWVVKDIQENFYPYLEKNKIRELTNRDARVFEVFFHERRRQLAALKSPSMYFEIMGQVEHWSVSQMHSIELGRKIKTDVFLSAILTEISKVYESLKSPLDAIEIKNVSPKAEIKAQVALQRVLKTEDIEHLASALQFQFENNIWVIFVTFDEKHILAHKDRLFEVCALHCCKPDYAKDYARDLTREKPPIQYYQDISPRTDNQEKFLQTIVKTLGITLTQ